MIYRILFFIGACICLFYPIYMFINFLLKRFFLIDSDDLQDQLIKTNNQKEAIKQEIKKSINDSKDRIKKLEKISKENN